MANGEGDKGGTTDGGDSGSNAGANDASSNLSNEANSRDSNPIGGGSRTVRNETSSEEPSSEEPSSEEPSSEEPSEEEPTPEEPNEEEEERPTPRSETRKNSDRDYEWPIVFNDPFTHGGASGGSGTEWRSPGGSPPRAQDIVRAGGTAVVNPIHDISVR